MVPINRARITSLLDWYPEVAINTIGGVLLGKEARFHIIEAEGDHFLRSKRWKDEADEVGAWPIRIVQISMIVSVERNTITIGGDQTCLVSCVNAIGCISLSVVNFGIELFGKHLKADYHWVDLLSCLRSRQVWETYLGRVVRHQFVVLVYLFSNVAAIN